MTVPQLMPWIGGATKFEADFSESDLSDQSPTLPSPARGGG